MGGVIATIGCKLYGYCRFKDLNYDYYTNY